MTEQKKRQPGRPSLSEEEKRSRNLTFRSRGDLRDRLSDAASKNGRSISEEIESRLEASYTKDERIEELKGRIEVLRQEIEDAEAKFQEDRNRLMEEIEERRESIENYRADAAARAAELQIELKREVSRLEGADAIFNALVGENQASREVLREIALLLAVSPDWTATGASAERMMKQIAAAFSAVLSRHFQIEGVSDAVKGAAKGAKQ